MTPTPSPKNLSGALSGAGILRAASVIMAAMILSALLGLLRQAAIAATFGAGRELDAFYAASRVPETLFVLVAGGALGSAFIPLFTQYLADDDHQGAWRLASATLSSVGLIAFLMSSLAFIFAQPLVAYILAPGADAETQALSVELMRLMLVTVIIFSSSGLLMGILNGHQHFLTPALAPSFYNFGLILGALVFARLWGIYGLAAGAVLGASFHLLIQVPIMRRLPNATLNLTFNWRGTGVSRVFWLMGPRVLGLGIVQINFWVNTALSSRMGVGSLTALTTAFTLMFTVLGILGQSLGTAVFPTLSRLYADEDYAGFNRTLISTLANVLFLSIPAGLGLALLSRPLVTVLFERGAWTSQDSAGTAWALALFSIGIAGHAALEILVRAFYALQDTFTPVAIGGLTMLLNIALSLIFIRLLGYPNEVPFGRGAFGGLALSMSIATALESLTLWLLLRRRINLSRDDVSGLQTTLIKTTAAAVLMALAVNLWLWVGESLPALPQLIGGVILGIVVFGGLALGLKIEEAQILPRLILRRFGK